MELTNDRGEKHNKHKPVAILDTYMQMQFLNTLYVDGTDIYPNVSLVLKYGDVPSVIF